MHTADLLACITKFDQNLTKRSYRVSYSLAEHQNKESEMIDLREIKYPTGLDADQSFRQAVEFASLPFWELPLKDARGFGNEALSAKVTMFGNPDAKDVIWVTAGQHGCEEFPLEVLLCELAENRAWVEGELGKDIRLVIAGQLNPWGTSHHSRFDHCGIDPNRNYRRRFPRRAPGKEYQRASDILNLTDLTLRSALWNGTRLWVKWKRSIGDAGAKRIIAKGQNTDPRGIQFTGVGPCWTNHTVRKIVNRFTPKVEGVDLHIDIHTGLGLGIPKTFRPLLITIYKPGADLNRAKMIWGDEIVTTTDPHCITGSDEGTIEQVFMNRKRRLYVGVCAELWMWHTWKAIAAIWLQHNVHRNAVPPDALVSKIARRFVGQVFFPTFRSWRNSIVPSLWPLIDQSIKVLRDGQKKLYVVR